MKTVEEILTKIDSLDNLEKYQEIIDMIEELPVEQLNSQIISEQGRAYNNIGEYNKAIEILKTIETEEKDTRRWNYRIGYSYYFLDDYENAEKYFLRADEIGPDDDEIKNYLLNIYIELSKKIIEENQEEAIEYALKAKNYIKTEDNKVQVYSYLAWMYDRIEAYDIAEDLLKSIINCKTDPRNEIWIYSELGYCLGEQHRYEESLEALIKASEMGRDDIWINSQIGWTFRILGKYEEALEYLFKAKELGRDDDWINAELGICYKEIDKFEEALESYLLANEKNGEKSIWILSEIAWIYGVLDKFDDELNYLAKVKKLGRKDEWINAEYGKVYARTEKYEEALKYFNKAKKLGQDDAWINIQMAICFKRLNKLKKSLEHYLLAEKFKDYKKDIWLLSEIAWTYDGLGKYKDGLKYLKKIDKLGRKDCWFYTEYGFCLMRLEKYKEAITKFKKGLQVKEELNEEIYLNSQIGFCYRLLGSEKTALKYHLKAKELGRNDAWINSEIGICYKDLDKYEKALEYYLLAYEEDKEEIWLLSDIGWLYNELDRYEEALEFLLEAEKLGRDDSWINAEIGQCLGRLEKYDEGIERLKKALELLEKDKRRNNTGEKIFINSEIGWLIGRKEDSNAEEALYYLNAAKALGRDDMWLNSEIAWELAYNDDKAKESIKYFEKAIKLGRKDEWIWSRVANIYFDLERYKDALDAYSKAYKLAKNSWYICNMGRSLRRLGKYEEAVKKLIQSRKLSLKEGDVVDLEDLELAYCYAALGDKKKAEKHMKLSIDSLGSRAENEEHLKEQFDEIKEMISVLSKPS